MRAGKKRMTNKKFTILWSSVITLLVIVTLVVNYVLTGPLTTVMDMYFGKGDIIISNSAKGEKMDTEYYKSDYANKKDLEDAANKTAVSIEDEGIVLLKNENNVLPLKKNDKAISKDNKASVSVFGRTSVDPIYTGAGSAATKSNPVDYKTALENGGFTVNNTLYDFYKNHPISTKVHKETMPTPMGDQKVEYKGRGFVSAMGAAMFINDIIAEVPATDITKDVTDSLTSYNDAAIVVLGRVGGEGCDLPTNMSKYAQHEEDKNKSYLELNSDEISLLQYVKAQKDAGVFQKIVVVLNTANAMELGFLNDKAYGIDAAMWVGCVGDQGTNAVASVLSGAVNPSGRLIDTYIYDMTKDPSYQNFAASTFSNVDGSIKNGETGKFLQYEEGIYVGYRYYETAAAEAKAGNYQGFDYDKTVQYPFGYGLSYSNFKTEFKGTPTYKKGTYSFDVTVTNEDKNYSGKQVVQIYAETPYTKGGTEKAKVVLAAFAKTDLLAPGKSQTLTLTVKAEDLASYDYKDNKAYVLDKGDYKFYLSDNAHSWSSIKEDDSTKFYQNTLDKVVYQGDNNRTSDKVTATNQFDDVSSVFTDTAKAGSPLNMSRSDFKGTYPTATTDADLKASKQIKTDLETVFDEENDPVMGNQKDSKIYTSKKITQGAKNGLSLIDLRGVDYNDKAWDMLLDEVNIKSTLELLSKAGYNTKELLSINKPATLDYDGSLGWSTWVSSKGADALCTGFPAQEIIAATFNVELAKAMGNIIGEEGLLNGFNGWYAPSMNTHRSAFAGRNYEYFSEDGLIAGTMAAHEVSASMEKGTYAYIKHFALNDKEDSRMGQSVFANEQAIREIYLKPFEVYVKEAKATIHYNDNKGKMTTKEINAATAVMTSYNCIGTKWSGGNYNLITNVLRNEWGFNGTILTDYFGGMKYMDSDSALRAGAGFMLNTFADGGLTDSKSATAQAQIRRATHDVLYTVVNSSAVQGLASGVDISYKMSGWQKLLVTGDVAAGVIALALVSMIVIRNKKRNKEAQ